MHGRYPADVVWLQDTGLRRLIAQTAWIHAGWPAQVNSGRAPASYQRRARLFIYVGSALDPGGVRARITRHCRGVKSKHWHIDYLRDAVTRVCAWYSLEPVNQEHHRAR